MAHLLAFVEGLPAVPLYIAIAVFAAVENVFPPVPADTVVAFGAFLAGRGTLDAWVVFGLTWVANTGSAAGMYLLGRHYGRPFLDGPIGRRMVSPEALAHVERAYERHGSYGIFVSRLLPVWRALVPPFAGVARVPARRALVPMVLASGLWYGALTYLVATFGSNFESVLRAMSRVNAVLAVFAVVILVALGVWIYRRAKR
ncbi:MAG TPA: DedA family protein [Gemmatimonadales bacterium]|nr:DedA family protein [Gemmatimonadales bacterium]